jgi:uncharacterized protein YbjT (DUF2867 family)
MSKTVAIFGATGSQGSPVVTEALAKGWNVRAVARNASLLQEQHPEAEAVEAQLSDENSVAMALSGVDAAFFHVPMPQNPEDTAVWMSTFLRAAHRVSLPLLVYTTSGPAGSRYPSSMTVDAGTEGMNTILNSGIPSIVLQPAIYLENLLPELFLPKLRTEGVLDYPPMPENTKVQWTSHLDQARIAVAAMGRPELAGNSYEIGTPDALTKTELATLMKGWVGREVRSVPLSPEGFGQRVGEVLGNPGISFVLSDLYGALATLEGDKMSVDTRSLEETFGVRLTSVAEHIAQWSES